MPESDPFGQRLQRLATPPPTDDAEAALLRVVRGARRRRARNRAAALGLVLAAAVAVATPRVLDAVGLGPTTVTTGTPAAGGARTQVRMPAGYVYEPGWLPPKVYRSGARDASAGPPVPAGRWSGIVLQAKGPCPRSCSEIRVCVLRGQPSPDLAGQARDYGGRVVTVRGRRALLLPPVDRVRDTAALVWREPSGLLVVIEAGNAEWVVTEQEVLGVAAGLKVPDDHGGRLRDPSFAGTGFEQVDAAETDLDPAGTTPAPFPRVLEHSFHLEEPEPGLDPPFADVSVYRGITAEALRERLEGGRCLEPTTLRGHRAWVVSSELSPELSPELAPPPPGEPCSLEYTAEVVWNEHDDVTIRVSVDTSIGNVSPSGVELLRRLAGSLHGR
ncbi:MAG TPA: hypothetical protein VKG45_14955 [Actinomycetes bacterium]|nr:hypothetical protein [Actinomycetes bacterium]